MAAAKTRVAKYKTPDGMFLDIQEVGFTYKIGWFDPTDLGDFGLMLENDPDCDDSHTQLAVKTAIAYFKQHDLDLPNRGQEIVLHSLTHARACLRSINQALQLQNQAVLLPEWAQIAMVEGWTPPAGWKP